MQKLAIRAGLRTINPTNGVRTGVRHDIQINHGLRKFFTTQVTKARVNHEMRELWLCQRSNLHRHITGQWLQICGRSIRRLSIYY